VRTLRVNAGRMREELDAGYTQATDLTEYIVQACAVDYRSAYVVVGNTVREASRRGIAGRNITGELLDEMARAETGRSWGLAGRDLSSILDPMNIVATRTATGGAAPDAVATMIAHCHERARDLATSVRARRAELQAAIETLLDKVRATAQAKETP